MNKRTVDTTNRKNRYCAHCENCRECDYFCKVKGRIMNYWNMCKSFQWREKYLEGAKA